MVWLLLLLPIYVAVDAVAQGKLSLLARLYIPQSEQKRVNLPLHQLYPVCYILLTIAVMVAVGSVCTLLVALLVRAGMFDIVLNLTKHDPLFVVGTSAVTDNLVNRVAALLHVSPALVSGAIRLLSLVAAVVLVVLCF